MAISKRSRMYLLGLPDCVALAENGACGRLDISLCRGADCPFLHTREEEQALARRAMLRLAQLDDQTQDKIARKYYHGERRWLRGQ